MSLQNDLDRIAELQGKVVPSGNFISGFGPGTQPPPEFGADPPEFPMDEEEDHAPTPPPEIRQAPPAPESHPDLEVSIARWLASSELTVRDSEAIYKGRSVSLNGQEKGLVVAAVLKALRRSLNELEAEVRPRRQRRRKPDGIDLKGEPIHLADTTIGNPPKKRGRPRKTQQRLDGGER